MKPKTIRIIYWILTTLFSIFFIFDGMAGIFQVDQAVNIVNNHLWYPVYTLFIFGIAKILGSLAIFQNSWKILKEWAFAGFTINFIGASLSHFFYWR